MGKKTSKGTEAPASQPLGPDAGSESASGDETKARVEPAKQPKGTCFILMPFGGWFDTYYREIFTPAVRDAHLRPQRADSLFRPGAIMADIWQMIQDTRVLLAELTTKNPNVFYELGLAHAIGKPVVLVSETMDDVPFDLRALRVLGYDKNEPNWGQNLQDAITESLLESIDEPIETVPSMYRKKVESQAPEDKQFALRLDELERRVAALTEAVPSYPMSRHDRLAGSFRGDLDRAVSRKEVVGATRRAVREGLPNGEIRKILRPRVSLDEIESIVVEAHRSDSYNQ